MCVRILTGFILSIALLASGQVTNPPGWVKSLSLTECVRMALTRNLDLQIESLNAEIAGYNLGAAWGAYVPIFAIRARHDYVSQPGDFDPQKFNLDLPYQLQNDLIGADFSGRLPMGLSYDLSGYGREDNARTDFRGNPGDARFFPPDGIRRTNNYFAETRLTLTQHLLKDFWIDPYRQTLLVRRKELKMSEQAVQFQIMRTTLAVELGYYDLLAARQRIGVQEKALELHQQFLKEMTRRVELGDVPPLDRDQAETQLQNTLTALAATRESFARQQNLVKNLISDDFLAWAELDLQPADTLLAVPTVVDKPESFRRALKNRPDLIEARLAVQRSDVIVRFRKNQLFPSLDLVGRYGGLGVDPDLGSALHQANTFDYPEYFYGVVVSLPLSNLAERNQYRASRAGKQMAELQLKKAEQEVLVQVADYCNRVQTSFEEVGSTRKARAYAESALAAEEKKLENGLTTSFVVLQLQEILTAARMAELQALVDYNKAQAQLAFAQGSTMENHQLKLDTR